MDTNTGQCKECEEGSFYNSGSCSSKRILFQIEMIFKVCSNSIPNCDACSDSSTCIECAGPYVIDTSNNLCRQCEEGTYYNFSSCLSTLFVLFKSLINLDCQTGNCSVCVNSGFTCNKCKSGFILNDENECEVSVVLEESCNNN